MGTFPALWRKALVDSLYHANCGGMPNTDSVVQWVEFTEGSGTTVSAYNGIGANGTFYGYTTTWKRMYVDSLCDSTACSGLYGRTYTSSFRKNGYRYAFNGKEHDPEWNGDGAMYDYGFRIYDPRIGKFLSVDPLTASYPWNSTYAFAEGDVVRSIDLDGLEKYIVHQRCFAPWDLFGQAPFPMPGHGTIYHGDNRNFSVSDNVTSRVKTQFSVDVGTGKEDISRRNAESDWSYSYDADDGTLKDKAKGNPIFFVFGPRKKANSTTTKTELIASNPLVKGSPPIQWQAEITITDNIQTKRNIEVEITVNGKGFPAYESFIEDSKGNRVFISLYKAPAKENFLTRLLGNVYQEKFTKSLRIYTDKDGNFTGKLKYAGTIYSIDEFNKTFENSSAADDK